MLTDSDEILPLPAAGEVLQIGALIHDVARLRRSEFDAVAKPMGLTRSQFRVLSYLGARPGQAPRQVDIANGLDLGKVTLGGLLDRLEVADFIQRGASSHDRRVKIIRLTAKGQRALQNGRRMRPQLDEHVMRGVAPHVRQELNQALQCMRGNLLELQRNRQQRTEVLK
jgi:DNA-binding MarR family transcriptional regulator